MNAIRQQYKTLVTAARPLPQVLRKPALLKLWLLEPVRARGLLFAFLLLFLVMASPLSQAIVDAWYPLNQNSLKTGVMELLNSPILRKLQALRETRYWQLLIFFWLSGLAVTSVILLGDLPRSIEIGKRRSAELLRQSAEAGETSRVPREDLLATANGLRLDADPAEPPAAEIATTRAITSAEKEVRFVGPMRRYRIDRALASGGAGIVYEAEDTVLGRKVALKELLQDLAGDAQQAERFKSEARALAVSNHSNILPVYDLLEEDGHCWLVMELLTGGTLGDRIKADGALELPRCIEIIRGIASGLGFAHEQGFVHRDVKPANILFAEDGSFRITDFGIAKHQSNGVETSHGLILGSPGYMSPEQAAGEPVDARSDIYSLGIVFYQMLTAELPFTGEVSAVMAQHITRPAPAPSTVNASVGQEIDAVVGKMLAKKAADRYQSAAELIEALDALSEPRPARKKNDRRSAK